MNKPQAFLRRGRPVLRHWQGALCILTLALAANAVAFDGPLVVSDNGRHLAFADGTPFYYVADTPWQLLASLPLDEAKEYIDIRRSQGFTALQLVATPWSFDDRAAHWDFNGERGQARVNADGEAPFFGADGSAPTATTEVDFSRPNDRYWRHVDAVLDHLAAQDMAAYFIPLWASNFASSFSEDDHYAIGRTLGARYRRQPNLLWALGGDEARVSVAKYRRLHSGLKDAGITQLVTMHPRAGRSSSEHMDGELDFDSVQDRGTVANMLQRIVGDHARKPTRPTFLCETWYEHPAHLGDGGVFGIHKAGETPAFRAHYWAARLHGGFGEGYGGWTNWLNLEHWRRDIRLPGAVAIAAHMQNILKSVDWENLQPDAGLVVDATAEVHAARSEASRSVVLYVASPACATVDGAWFGDAFTVAWHDPADGRTTPPEVVSGKRLVCSPLPRDAVAVLRTRLRPIDTARDRPR